MKRLRAGAICDTLWRMPVRRHPWYDAGWPLLAGAVAAVGLISGFESVGLRGCIAAFALMEVTVGATAWAILTDTGRPARRALFEVGPACGLATVVAVGLTSLLQVWGLVLLLLTVSVSPLLRRQDGWFLGARPDPDSAVIRRRFDEIVAHGFAEDDPL